MNLHLEQIRAVSAVGEGWIVMVITYSRSRLLWGCVLRGRVLEFQLQDVAHERQSRRCGPTAPLLGCAWRTHARNLGRAVGMILHV